MKVIYKSKDGIEFSSKKECETHEKLLDKAESIAAEKYFRDMGEGSFAEILLELSREGKIKIL
jgi:hypothetical protein